MRGKRGTGTSKKYSTKGEITALYLDQAWKKADEKTIREIEQGVAKRARQVYTRMVKGGVLSPSMGRLESSQGVMRGEAAFTAAKGSKEEAIRNINNYLNFMMSDSTGIKGAKNTLERTKQTLIDKGVDAGNLSYYEADLLWKVIDEERNNIDPARFYEAVDDVIAGLFDGLTVDELIAMLKEKYENKQ